MSVLKQMVLQLSKSESLLKDIQLISKTGGWEYDVASKHFTMTDMVYNIHEVSKDYDPNSLLQNLEYYSPENGKIFQDAFQKAIEGISYDLVMPFITAKGNKLWVRKLGKPVFENGKVVRVLGNIMDITELKVSEEKIKKLNEELELRVSERTTELMNANKALEAANKELQAFSYSVSHDLRAPLRALDGFARILVEDYSSSLDAEGLRLLNVITTNAKNMGLLIDDLLAFSRLNQQEIKQSKIDMQNMADSIYHEIASNEEKKIIEFNVLPVPDAYGDPSMIRQVWKNLIGNAIKFSAPKANRCIEVGTINDNGEAAYFIRDNGVGFDMRYVDKLYGVFQRLHNSKDFEGTGVGLAIVKRIIHRHGGRVWADGIVNKGAAFYFTLNNKNGDINEG